MLEVTGRWRSLQALVVVVIGALAAGCTGGSSSPPPPPPPAPKPGAQATSPVAPVTSDVRFAAAILARTVATVSNARVDAVSARLPQPVEDQPLGAGGPALLLSEGRVDVVAQSELRGDLLSTNTLRPVARPTSELALLVQRAGRRRARDARPGGGVVQRLEP